MWPGKSCEEDICRLGRMSFLLKIQNFSLFLESQFVDKLTIDNFFCAFIILMINFL